MTTPYPYPPPYPPPPPQNNGTNGLAVASMVIGICGLLFLWVIGPILAVIFGHVSLGQIKKTGQGGRGLALTGVITGWIGVAIAILFFVLFIVAGVLGSGS